MQEVFDFVQIYCGTGQRNPSNIIFAVCGMHKETDTRLNDGDLYGGKKFFSEKRKILIVETEC